MRFIDKLILKQNLDNKLMIYVITCWMLKSPYTSDYDEMDNDDSKLTVLEPTIKKLMKETNLGNRSALNFARIGQNIRA